MRIAHLLPFVLIFSTNTLMECQSKPTSSIRKSTEEVSAISSIRRNSTATTDAGLQFIAVTPCRVADTRNSSGPFGGPALVASAIRNFNVVQSSCGIPANAVAYSLNVTVVPDHSLGYLTLWPTGQNQPYVSTLNSDGRVKANAAIVPAGTNGAISVFVTDATEFILDINGYFVPEGTTSALLFYPISPCRIADTRQVSGLLGGPSLNGGNERAFPILSSSCNIPSTAQAYSLNITAVPHGSLGYLSLWPTGESQPVVSTLNSSTGVATANAAIVPAGNGGDISAFASDDLDLIIDANGYFAPPLSGGLSLYTVTPCRVLDTRNNAGAFNGVLPISVQGSACAISQNAQAYVLNATAVPSNSLAYLTLWPAEGSQPYVSTLNASDGAVTSNMALVGTLNGNIDAYSASATNLVLDASAYFATAAPARTPVNTNDPTYLPLALNNKWTFSDGSYLLDAGPLTEVCCVAPPINWLPFPVAPEDLVYYDKNGAYVFDMMVVKAPIPFAAGGPYVGEMTTWLVGFATDGPLWVSGLPPILVGTSTDYTIPGLPWIVNESPQVGQVFYDDYIQHSVLTVQGVNGIQLYGQTQEILDVAQLSLSAPGLAQAPQQSLYPYATGTYSLAYGVGFTTFPGPNGTTLQLTNFSIATTQ